MKRAGVLAAVLLLTACATSEPAREGHWRDGDRHRGAGRDDGGFARAMLFISPCGQPFRARWGQPYPVAVWFAQADSNHDGRLDRTEFRADAEAFFRVLDRNHDGVIDGAEVSYYEQNIVPEILSARASGPSESVARGLVLAAYQEGGGLGGGWDGQRGGGHRRGQGGGEGQRRPETAGSEGGQGAAPYGLLNEPEPVTAADTELNGRITLAEFLQAADRRFDLLDKNHDGYLTLAELPLTPVQARMQARAHPAAQG